MQARLRIVPVNKIDSAFLVRLGLCLEERFLFGAFLEPPLEVPRSSLNSVRSQMFVPTLTAKVLRKYGAGELLLALTEFDLYKTSHRYVFGDADAERRIAVVSFHRLRPEFYGEGADPNALFQRTLKESVHELGHAVGLRHCYDTRCAMHYSNSIFETDNKAPNFCHTCERRGRARR